MADQIKNTYENEQICEDCILATHGYGYASEEHQRAVEERLEGMEDLVYSLDGEDDDWGPQSFFGTGCFSCGDFSLGGARYDMTVTEFFTDKRS